MKYIKELQQSERRSKKGMDRKMNLERVSEGKLFQIDASIALQVFEDLPIV